MKKSFIIFLFTANDIMIILGFKRKTDHELFFWKEKCLVSARFLLVKYLTAVETLVLRLISQHQKVNNYWAVGMHF